DFTSADLIGDNPADGAIDTYTGELRVASDFDGFFNFLVGAYYFKEDIDIQSSLTFGSDFVGYANLLSGGAYSSLEPTLRALIPTIPAGTFGAEGQGRFENYQYGNDAFSIFGQLDFDITDELTFTVGGNFTTDKKRVVQNNVSTDVFSSIDLIQAGFNAAIAGGADAATAAVLASDPATNPFLGLQALQFIPPYLNFPNAVEDGRTKDNDLSYTFRLAYEVNQNISVYASYATGFKASSFNLGTDSRPFASDFIPGSPFQSPPPAASPIRDAGLAVNNLTTGTRFADPEEAEVYEVGLKAQFDGLAFNLAIFDQTLNGFQGNIFTGTGFILDNAEQQSVRGFEFDASISPIPELNFTAALTYLDPKFDSFIMGSALTPAFSTISVDLSGERPAGIPEYSLSFGGTYSHEFDSGNELVFHADYLLESNVQIAQGLPEFRRAVEALNASVTFAMGNGFEVTAWGRNLTNDRYTTTIFPSVAQAGSLSGYRNQPRTYGGLVRYRF
ncbi:MAG: TonB-dependent receptor, partial [Pseudomonadota bacterium]